MPEKEDYMRDLKFRAWHKKENYMTCELDLAKIQFERGRYLPDYEWMKYTGLKDKQGKEIYEDDIVKFKWNRKFWKGQVAWGTCGFWVIGWLNILDRHDYHEVEVIGNIYENPEEVGKELVCLI